MIPSGPKGLTVAQARASIAELRDLERQDPTIRRMMDVAEKIEGYVQSIGTHAAGVVIADAPITDYLPLVTVKKAGTDEKSLNTQFEMNLIEDMGLLKIGLLGPAQPHRHARGRARDPAPCARFQSGRHPRRRQGHLRHALAWRDQWASVQLESDGMKRICIEMKPSRLDDIIALVALYRRRPDGADSSVHRGQERAQRGEVHPPRARADSV